MGDERASDSRPVGVWRWVPVTLIVAIAAVSLWGLAPRRKALKPITAKTPTVDPIPSSPYRNTAAGVAYVGDEVCAVSCGDRTDLSAAPDGTVDVQPGRIPARGQWGGLSGG